MGQSDGKRLNLAAFESIEFDATGENFDDVTSNITFLNFAEKQNFN